MQGDRETKAQLSPKRGAAGRGGGKDSGKGIISLKIFAPAIVFTIIMFGTLAWFAWYSYRHMTVVEAEHFKATELVGRITHLDEVLTMSARMAAATGDPQWELRYGDYEPQLDAAIKDVTDLAPEALMSEAAAQTDAANVKLVEMERAAFGLVRAGDPQAAMAMLHSVEYAEQKRIYSGGMKDFTEGLQRHTRAELRRHRRQVLIAASFVAVSVSLVLFVWVGMLQRLKYDSERRSLGKALRRSDAQFKEFFANTAVGFYRTSPAGRVLAANPALVRMLGYSSSEELAQRNIENEGYEPQYSRSEFKKRIEKEGRVVGLESAWVKRDGTTVFVIENCRAIRDERGNTLYYEGTAENITERKKAENTLKESEEKYRTLIANIPDVTWTSDSEGNTTFISPNVEQIYGYGPEEICARGDSLWFGRIHPDDSERVRKAFGTLFEENTHFDFEYRIQKKNGEWIWLHDRSVATYARAGVRYADGIFSDVTQRRKAEKEIRESQTLIQGILDNTNALVVVRDTQGRYLLVNKHVEDVLDLQNKEIIGKTPHDIHSSDKADKIMADDRMALESRALLSVEDQLEVRGEMRTFLGSKFPLLDAAGECYGVCAVMTDITERKTAEDEVKKFKTIAERAGYGVGMIDLEGKLLYVNESFAKMHGYGVDELIGKSVSIFHAKEQMERVNRLNEQLLQEGSYVGEEVWHKRRDNTPFPTLMNGTLIGDEKGKSLFMAATAIDITERKRAEAALRQSEQRYKTLVENLPQRVFLKDRDLIYVSCNENFARDLGINPEDVAGKSDYDFFATDLAEKYRADDKRVMESGEINDIEEVYILGGRETTVHTVKTPVRDEDGEVVGVLGIFWDITEQKRLERALRESEEKYRTLVESAGETIVTIARDGKYLFMNKIGAERAGRKVEDYVGKTMWDMHPKHIADRQMNTVRKVMDSEEGVNLTVQAELQGQSRWYNVTIEPLRDSSGKVAAALVVGRDIHEIRQAEMELEIYREKMTRAERLASLGTLSATLAHELTQPLTVIGLSIEDALAELEGISCPEAVGEGLRDSLSAVSNATTIVERFRSFARKSSGKSVEKVELRIVAEGIIKLLKKSAQQARVAVHLKGVDELPAVYLNEKEMEQLFFALVQNAIHAADGKTAHNLVVEGAVKSEYIELRFSDDCGGIEQADVDKVFEPFFTTKSAGEGTGLGLCIVQRVAERSGGRVRVENRSGEGVTFVVTLGISKDSML